MTGRGAGAGAQDRVMLQVRLLKELVRRLDHFCVDRELFRAQACEILLAEALRAREAK